MSKHSIFFRVCATVLLFFLLLTFEISQACGPSPRPAFHGYSFVNESVLEKEDRNTLAPFLMNMGQIYQHYFQKPDSLNTHENLNEWMDKFCGLVEPDDLEYFIYKSSITDLELLKTHTQSKTLPVPARWTGNTVAAYVHANKCVETIDYLVYAKKCEPHVTALDGWQKPKRNTEAMKVLIEEGVKQSKHRKLNSHYLRMRYAYQVIRLAHYAGLYQEALDLYDELIPAIDKVESGFGESIIPWWIEGHRAGAMMKLGNRVEASYIYAKIFRYCRGRRFSAYQSFDIRTDQEWEECLRLCYSDAERAMLYAIRAAQPKSRAVEEMQAIYRLDPENPQLEVLLIQEIRKMERNLLGLKFNSRRAENKRYYNLPRPDAGQYVISLQAFVRKVREERKVERPVLWRIAEGYLEFMAGDFYAAEKTYREAMRETDDKALREQLAAFQLAMTIARFEKPDPATEEKAYEIIKRNELYASYEDFPEYLRDKMRWLYEKNGQRAKAFLCYESLDQLKPNPIPEMVDELLAVMLKDEQTNFERTLTRQFSTSDLLDMKATYLMSQGQMEAALEVYNRIPATEWVNYGQYDPFLETFEDRVNLNRKDSLVLSTKLNRGELIQALLDLEFKAKAEVDRAARHYYRLGLAYYNMSYFGYEWKAMDYFRSGTTWSKLDKGIRGVYPHNLQPLGNLENTDLSRALYFFEKAHLLARTDELKARAAFQAARCEQKMFFMSDLYQPEPCCNRIPRLTEEYLVNFSRLKNQYAETEFYQRIIRECKYFEVYARK